jgi:hypothetical protein
MEWNSHLGFELFKLVSGGIEFRIESKFCLEVGIILAAIRDHSDNKVLFCGVLTKQR